MHVQYNSLRLADQLANAPYAWPGGYPKFAVTSDGACLCHNCCRTERESFANTTGSDGWNVTGIDVNWEDGSLYCDHCSERIEAAYVNTND